MKKDLEIRRPSGSAKKNEPKVIGEVLSEYFKSNEPLAVVFCNRQADDEATAAEADISQRLFRDYFPDTHLDVDLKVISRKPGRMQVGANINCMLRRDDEFHFTAMETASEKKQTAEQRNPIVYLGTCINLHRNADGTIYPTFNRPRYTADFTFADYCREAAEELLAVAGLVEEEWK